MTALARGWALMVCALLLAGCAYLNSGRQNADPSAFWSGRLALQVDGSALQSFAASFELKGSAETGELILFNPLGGTLARLVWQPGSATLHANGDVQPFDSLEALVAQATGAPLPLAALFDWLHGSNTQVPGWQADLARLEDGRITAVRSQPEPTATLRLVLDK
ncbi:outer membrane lipoprotein LolB [Rhodoferax sp.]|uniref:outer membrane lipoprotein LolB n=1 Tax=Rhodoferax sp. TaxID=50421 RepID=UPI0025F469DE|nr:outer membrane lipoprotein LolB [Rhodoferax sp.]